MYLLGSDWVPTARVRASTAPVVFLSLPSMPVDVTGADRVSP